MVIAQPDLDIPHLNMNERERQCKRERKKVKESDLVQRGPEDSQKLYQQNYR